VDWEALAQAATLVLQQLAEIAKPRAAPVRARRRVGVYCVNGHGRDNPACRCDEGLQAPLGLRVLSGGAKRAGRSEAPLELISLKNVVVVKQEKTA